MSGISTSVKVNDGLSAPFRTMTQSINICLGSFVDMQEATGQSFNTSSLNAARAAMNDANIAASQLSNEIQEAGNKQQQFNEKVNTSSTSMNGLVGKVMGLVGAYASIQGIKGIATLSDTITQNTARLDLMNDGLQTTAELNDMIFESAQRARASYLDTANTVAQLGNRASDAFSSNQELIAFSETLNKMYTIAGAGQQEMSSASLQLTQALGSGILRGEEFNAVFEAAPNVMQAVADYMDVPIGQLRTMASDGEITADIVKNALLSATDEVNTKFETMPKTWAQVVTGMENRAIIAFQPILNKVNELANSDKFSKFSDGAINSLYALASVATSVFDVLITSGSFVYDNWSLISPVIGGVTTAFILYTGAVTANNVVLGIHAGISAFSGLQDSIYAAKIFMATGATLTQTAAQVGLNAALLACPITWIILVIIAVIAIIYLVIAAINHFADTSYSATGFIAGIFAVLAAHILNTFVIPTCNFLISLANFFANIFVDPVAAVKILFLDMAEAVLGYMINMAQAIETVINKIPGVEVDITSGLDSFYNQLETASQSIKDESDWKATVEKIDYIQYDDAARAGYKAGKGIESKVTGIFDNASAPLDNTYDSIASSTGATADNTSDIADSLEITDEDLKYLRDIAEREIIDRTVFKSLRVDMGGVSNTVNNMQDLDGLADYLGDVISETASASMEG